MQGGVTRTSTAAAAATGPTSATRDSQSASDGAGVPETSAFCGAGVGLSFIALSPDGMRSRFPDRSIV